MGNGWANINMTARSIKATRIIANILAHLTATSLRLALV
jgi:hypothetical protein